MSEWLNYASASCKMFLVSRIIFLSSTERNRYFGSLKKVSGLSWKDLSNKFGKSQRHLTDIKNGKFSLPSYISDLVRNEYGLELSKEVEIKEDYWYAEKAAKLGGKRRFELYGPLLATYESRRRGGLNSLKSLKQKRTGFIFAKKIKIPQKGSKLAEVIGALIGDGGISTRQVNIYLNLLKDREYALLLKKYLQELFEINVSLNTRKKTATLVLTASSTNLVLFFNKNGLPIGNKIKQEIDIPKWIMQNKNWQQACLRGLFDTDGCTYIDHHMYKNKVYGHLCLAFTSYSKNLLRSVYNVLVELDYTPTLNNKRNVLLRKENEVLRFFREIKPHNNSHFDKMAIFMEEYRSGRNGAASKADGDESSTRVRISPPPQK